jgi:catechol 2,3-dioxygenase-like lactoylglutathione lyase family enzyme
MTGKEISDMLPDPRIVYLFLYVRDLAVSRDWFENILGLRVLEEDAGSVKYDCGTVILALNRAEDYGVELPTEPDHSTDIVFLVDDLDEARAALEARGVRFTETHRYEIGAITDFYDPDNHWFTIYQTSDESLTWPSGDRIQAVRRVHGNPDGGASEKFTLDGKPLIYLFLFVRDPDDAERLYAGGLGIRDIEGGPCSRGSTADEEGVIKYDTGGMMLATHALETIREEHEIVDHPCPPRTVNPPQMRGKAMVFHTPDIEASVAELTARGVRFGRGVVRSGIGAVAEFSDSSGHVSYLWQPSREAMDTPSGARLRELLATSYEPA